MRGDKSTDELNFSDREERGLRHWLAALKARLSNRTAGDRACSRYTELLRLDIVALNGTPPSVYGWQRDRLLDPIRRWRGRTFSAGTHPADELGPLMLRPVCRSAASSPGERALWHAA